MPNYIILHVNQTILAAGSWEKPKELSKNRSPQGHFVGQNSSPLIIVASSKHELGYLTVNALYDARNSST